MSFVLDHVRRVDAQLDRLYYNYNYSLKTLSDNGIRARNADSQRSLLLSLTESVDSSIRGAEIGVGERRSNDGGEESVRSVSTSREAVQSVDEELASRILKLQALVKVLGVDSSTTTTTTTMSSSLGDGTFRAATSAAHGLLSPRQLGLGLSRARLSDRMCKACRRQQQQQQQQQSQVQRQKQKQHTEDGQQTQITPMSEKMSAYEHELEWLMLSKVAAQTYGQVLSTILELTIPLSDDLWYWDDVLGSNEYAMLYLVQMSPLWAWQWSRSIYADARARRSQLRNSHNGDDNNNNSWTDLLNLVREVFRERMGKAGLNVRNSMSYIFAMASTSMLSPVARVKTEARSKQAALKRFRVLNANALGVLVGEALNQDCGTVDASQHFSTLSPTADSIVALEQQRQKYKRTIAKSVALMDAVLLKVSDAKVAPENFDDAIATCTNEDGFYVNTSGEDNVIDSISEDETADGGSALRPALVAERLQVLLDVRLPSYVNYFQHITEENGKPARAIRYWPAAVTLLLSSSTILRVLFNRKERILNWIREFGTTTIDFWHNWIVTPIQNIVKTVRHDEGSELALLSKQSLEGDRASLERMVIDFAADNPEVAGLKDDGAAVAAIRQKVREGDLTPVLRAYEQDLKRPVMGALTGNLIRTLLIQIQKTKVDVEVAVGGIDALLKSQELVFGFIGLTPGILVCVGLWHWLRNILGSRKVLKQGKRQNQLLRMLRNIDRILTAATPTDFGELYYKDQGLVLCEVHILRQSAKDIIPGRVYREFLEDVDELVDVRNGLQRQEKTVHRVRWAYARWIT